MTTEERDELCARFHMTWAEVDRAIKMFPVCDPALACAQHKAQLTAKRKIQRRNRLFMHALAEGLVKKIPPPTSNFEPECRQHPDMWFSNDLFVLDQAQQICSRCPIQMECLRKSIENGEHYGTWGGLDERRRGPLIREHHRKRQEAAIAALSEEDAA